MANKSFLNSEQWSQAQEVLMPPLMTPNGDVRQVVCFSAENFSLWLGAKLEEVFKLYADWKDCHPIILGSWARNELCPKSDIDVLFCGDEVKVKSLVDSLNERGLKLRYRMPANPNDWTENVEAFDILALLKGRPWTPEAARKLHEQQRLIWSKKTLFRKSLLKAIKEERKKREERYDSITNYLEPNLKYGPGGLRDLEQGLQIYELFAEKFSSPGHALNVLQYYSHYFVNLRQKLHLEGYSDILTNSVQFDVAKWTGFKSNKDFMRDLQRGLSRVHFYSDWIIQVAESSEKELKNFESLSFKKMEDLYLALHKNSSVLVQKKVRENLDAVLTDKAVKQLSRRRGQVLEKILDVKAQDTVLVSVFRSRLIDKLVPEIRRLVGYVQHDQYHRFTADSHIMQACREVKRIYKKPKELGALSFLHKKLKPEDWRILTWSCLYHDLAKGLESSKHHSDLGVEIVERDFKTYGFKKSFTDEVKWMVENHLELSQAAFRKNPKDPKVWQELHQKGIQGSRLLRLALFTAIDIRATNPEAWNDWKAQLLKELTQTLESKKAQDYFSFETLKKRKKLNVSEGLIEELSPVLLETVPMDVLVDDLKKAQQGAHSLKPRVVTGPKGDHWVRFHEKVDRTGLLSDYVSQLYSLGLGIRQASIHTIQDVGVYDWFRITTTKNIQQIAKVLENSTLQRKENPIVRFDSIQLVSADENEWVISFKGPDQNGLLASAARSLSDLGVNITSAKVHTWGRQIDDIFFVKAKGDSTHLIQALKEKFQVMEEGTQL